MLAAEVEVAGMFTNGLDVAGLGVGVMVSGDELGLMAEEMELPEDCAVELTELTPAGDEAIMSRSKAAVSED